MLCHAALVITQRKQGVRVVLKQFLIAAAAFAVAVHLPAQISAKSNHSAYGKGLPPGLAKKGKVPPGHAKRWAVGRPLPYGVGYVVIVDPGRYRLPPARSGEIWIAVDGDVLRVARAGLLVLAAAGAVSELLH